MKKKFFLVLLHAAIFIASISLATTFRSQFDFFLFNSVYSLPIPLDFQLFYYLFLPTHLLTYYFFGFYQDRIKESFFPLFLKSLLANSASFTLFTVFAYLFNTLLVPRSVLLIIFLFAASLTFPSHFLFFSISNFFKKKRALLIEDFSSNYPPSDPYVQKQYQELLYRFQNFKGFKLQLIGGLTKSNAKPILPAKYNNYPFFGSYHNLKKVVNSQNIHIVFVYSDSIDFKEKILSTFDTSSFPKTILYFYPSKYEISISLPLLRYLNLDGIPFLRIRNIKQSFALKKIIDFALASALLTLLLPFFTLIYALIRFDSKGNGFFSQERVGQKGKKFSICKFRTMQENAEIYTGPTLSSPKDYRVTRIGKTLRRLRIDEFPQLFNILKGEMSFIGPRPERPFFIEKFTKKSPYYLERLEVKPGLTGLAQVEANYHTHFQDKLRYDLWYVHHYSFYLDLLILLRTIKVMLTKSGS